MSRRNSFNITAVTTDSGLVRGEYDPENGWTIMYRWDPKNYSRSHDAPWGTRLACHPRSYRDAYDVIGELDAALVRFRHRSEAESAARRDVMAVAGATRVFGPANDEFPATQ